MKPPWFRVVLAAWALVSAACSSSVDSTDWTFDAGPGSQGTHPVMPGGGDAGIASGDDSPSESAGPSSSDDSSAPIDTGVNVDTSTGDDGGITTPGSFRHPGALLNSDQIAFLTMKIAAGASPWAAALAAAKGDSHASLSYTPHPPVDTNGDVGCGSYSSPDIHCSDEKSDAAAAYSDALIWAVTGDAQYAMKSIAIMNAWSAVMKTHSLSNAIVQTGWVGTVFARAAELVRYTNAGWAAADVDKFASMLRTAYLPYVINGAPVENGNWELSAADALIQIAVFLDDQASFDAAIALWKRRVPAYFYLSTDGPMPVSVAGHTPSWNGATKYFDGLCQETCRDLGHTQYGLAAAINVAETARIQGVDLYSLEAKRLVTTLELHAGYLNSHATSSPACALTAVTPDPMWEIAYNEYANRLSTPLPNVSQLLGKIRPTGEDHHMEWETLSHAEVGSVGIH